MSWIIDNSTSVYTFLGVVSLILLFLWWRSRDRRYLYGIGGAAAIALLVALLGSFIATDFGNINGVIKEMGAAVQRKDTEGIFRHISDDFHVRSMSRAQFKAFVQQVVRNGEVTEIRTWNEQLLNVSRQGPTQGTATMRFSVKVLGPGGNDSLFGDCEATFILDKEGRWKLKGFEVFKPGSTEQFPIPGL
jgi:hypothetical protein